METTGSRIGSQVSEKDKENDDVIKWKLFPRYWPFLQGIHRSSVNSLHKGQWPGALMFSLIAVEARAWVNNYNPEKIIAVIIYTREGVPTWQRIAVPSRYVPAKNCQMSTKRICVFWCKCHKYWFLILVINSTCNLIDISLTREWIMYWNASLS